MLENCYYIKEQYFIDHDDYIKLLDPQNLDKQSKRTYLCVCIQVYNKNFYIPLRNNLGESLKKYGRIGHSVPSTKRPNAGLDYRYSLIIDNPIYLEKHIFPKLPNSQYIKLHNDYDTIVKEFTTYLRGFIKACYKNRVHWEPLYRESSLINYCDELKTLYVPKDSVQN